MTDLKIPEDFHYSLAGVLNRRGNVSIEIDTSHPDYLRERIAQLTAERDYFKERYGTTLEGEKKALEAASSIAAENDALDADLRECNRAISQIAAERDAALRKCERLKEQLLDWENREGTVCPEDVGFEEFVGALKAELSRLKAPVSDEEWGKGCHLANRSHVNDIIANRSKPQEEKP